MISISIKNINVGDQIIVNSKENIVVTICQPVYNDISIEQFIDFQFVWKPNLYLQCKVVYIDIHLELIGIECEDSLKFSTELDMEYFNLFSLN